MAWREFVTEAVIFPNVTIGKDANEIKREILLRQCSTKYAQRCTQCVQLIC